MTLEIATPPDVDAETPPCDSLDALSSILRRIAALDSELAEIEHTARIERERIDAWVAGEAKRIDHRRSHLLSVIEPWVAERLARAAEIDSRAPRSIATAWGRAGFRASPARVEVEDESALLSVASEVCPEVIRTVPERHEVDKRALAKLPRHGDRVAVEGEVLPGVRVIPGEDRFYVESAQ